MNIWRSVRDRAIGDIVPVMLLSAAFVFYLAWPVLHIAAPNVTTINVMLSGVITLTALQVVFLLPLYLFPHRAVRRVVLVVATFLFGLYLILDNLHFNYVGQHLFSDQLALIVGGVRSDMIEIPRELVGIGFVAFLVWVLSVQCILWCVSKAGPFIARGIRQRMVVTPLSAIIVISPLWEFTAIRSDNTARELHRIFFWHAALEDSVDSMKVKDQSFVKGLEITEEALSDSFHRMFGSRQQILRKLPPVVTRPNILFLVVEGLRSDMFTESTMPNLYGQRGEWMELPRHYTSGANSGTGDFGMVNGLASVYYPHQKQTFLQPVTFDVFKKLGYSLSIFFSNDMRYERVYDLMFARAFDRTIQPPKEDQPKWDEKLVEAYISDIKENSEPDKPRLDFLRLFVTHYNYFYPTEFEKFKPALPPGFRISSGRREDFVHHQEGLKNRYRNSVLYADHLIERILDGLRKAGRLDDTVIVLAGDHGEEFWEHGSFGHTFGLVNEQIQTTALIRFPTSESTPYKISAHQDFMPTIFDYLGVYDAVAPVMTGKSLLREERDRDVIVSSIGLIDNRVRHKYVAVSNQYKVYFQIGKAIRVSKVTDLNDKIIPIFDKKAVRRMIIQARSRLFPLGEKGEA